MHDPLTVRIWRWAPLKGQISTHVVLPVEPIDNQPALVELGLRGAYAVEGWARAHDTDPTGIQLHLDRDGADGGVRIDMSFPGAMPPLSRASVLRIVVERIRTHAAVALAS